MKNSINMISIIFLLLSYHSVTNAQVISSKLLGDFQEDWKKHWIERNLFQLPKQYHGETGLSEKSTPYRVVEDKHNLVLKVESNESTTALWRMLNIHPVNFGRIKWRWKVDRSLSHNKRERQKVGDDYAARLFVVFEPHLLSWKTRALCYVWAGKEPVGSIYKNPYAKSVGTIVIESGNDGTGKWVSEQRNFVMDYQTIFGKTPEMVSGVAIMVDTDNTHSNAIAWFDDIILELWNPKIRSSEILTKKLKLILKEKPE